MSAPKFSLILSPRAQKDFRDIRVYGLREWGPSRAEAYQVSLMAGFERLRDFPEIGKARDDLEAGLRSWVVGHHVLYYRVGTEAIEIARILHARADPARQQLR